MNAQDTQNCLDIIQQQAAILRAAGYDVSDIIETTRDINQAMFEKQYTVAEVIREVAPDHVTEKGGTVYVNFGGQV